MKQIINGKIVTPEGVLEGKTLVMGERIEEIADSPREGLETVDALGGYVLPGLIDLHIHGYAGKDAVDGTDEAIVGMAEGVLKNGVTAFLPTTLTVSYETLEKAFDCARNVQKAQKTDKELAKRSLEITPVLEIGRTDIITHLLTKSDMISYLPDFVTKKSIESGELCYLDVRDMQVEIWKQLIYHKNKWMSKTLKTVIEYIKSHEFSS